MPLSRVTVPLSHPRLLTPGSAVAPKPSPLLCHPRAHHPASICPAPITCSLLWEPFPGSSPGHGVSRTTPTAFNFLCGDGQPPTIPTAPSRQGPSFSSPPIWSPARTPPPDNGTGPPARRRNILRGGEILNFHQDTFLQELGCSVMKRQLLLPFPRTPD